MEKIRVLEITARKKMRVATCAKSREGTAVAKVFRMPNIPNRESRVEALLTDEDYFPIPGFILQRPPRRYLIIEMDEFGGPVGAYQAGTLPEIAKLLESAADTTEARIVEIHDLDTGDLLRPDYERVYRVPRIYRGHFIVYQSPSQDDQG
jgi:hypothetical protein